MRVIQITAKDIQSLRDRLQRDPKFGPPNVGVCSQQDRQAYDDAHRFYNFHVESWLQEIQKDAT